MYEKSGIIKDIIKSLGYRLPFPPAGGSIVTKKKAYLMIASAAALWGTIGIFRVRLGGFGLDSLQLVALRVTVSALAMVAVLLIKDPKLLKIRLRDLWMFLGTGVVSLACFNFCYCTAMQLTSLSVAAALLYTSPIFVLVFSAILFKERFTAKKAAALLLTFSGCLLVTGVFQGSGSVSALGILAGLGSGLGYALYTIFGSYALKRYNTLTITAYTFVFAAAGTLPLSRPAEIAACLASWEGAVWSAAFGLATCVLPYLLYTKGLSCVPAGKAAIVATLEPVVAAGIGIFVFQEDPSPAKLAGIALILGSIVLLNLRKKKKI